MQFSYSCTFAEAREAFWLFFWTPVRKITVGLLSLIMFGEITFAAILLREDLAAGLNLGQILRSDSAGMLGWLLGAPLFFVLYVFVFVPWRCLRPIRKNPSLLNTRQASVTSDQFEVQAEGGSSSLKWAMYKYWREGKNVIILKVISGQYQMISKTGLSEAQLDQLRNILIAALPRKR